MFFKIVFDALTLFKTNLCTFIFQVNMADAWDDVAPAEIEEAPVVAAPLLDTQEIKVFNKWSLSDVEVSDISLVVCCLILYFLCNFNCLSFSGLYCR